MNNIKNIIVYITLFSGLFLINACDKVPLPLADPKEEPDFDFVIREKNGEKADFFNANDSLYNKDSVYLLTPNSTYPIHRWRHRVLSDKIIFAINGYRSIDLFYIDYRNGDKDTLTKVVVADKDFPLIRQMKKLTWYFNGKEAKVFDFENTPGLAEELYTRNCFGGCLRENSIIIDLYK